MNMNNFNHLRLLASLLVLYSHSFALYGIQVPVPFKGQSLGALAVYSFFFISGNLVFQSWEREPSLINFWIKRIFRIFPGLFFSVVFSVFVIGFSFTILAKIDYLRSAGTWQNFFNNIFAIATIQTLPGVFLDNPFAQAVNGSLWTIRYELLMYLLLSLICASFLFNIRRVTFPVVIAVLSFVFIWLHRNQSSGGDLNAFGLMGNGILLAEVSKLGVFFFLGSSFSIFSFRKVKLCGLISLILLPALLTIENELAIQLLTWIFIPCLVHSLAHLNIDILIKNPLKTDISYGVYIYAFPIQQAISKVLLDHGYSWSVYLMSSLLLVIIVAYCSWKLIEFNSIQVGRRLIAKIR